MQGRTFRWALTVWLVLVASAAAQMTWRHYDASKETTVSGAIVAVNDVECDMCGAGKGTHVTLQTEAEQIEVLLGPAAFLSKQEFTLAKGDEIEVVGSKMKMENEEQLIAREVKKGDVTLTLRDKTGRPKWAGRGGRRR